MDVQMFPRLHAENFCSVASATGLMMNWELALQLSFDNGQQTTVLFPVSQPEVHWAWSCQRDYSLVKRFRY